MEFGVVVCCLAGQVTVTPTSANPETDCRHLVLAGGIGIGTQGYLNVQVPVRHMERISNTSIYYTGYSVQYIPVLYSVYQYQWIGCPGLLSFTSSLLLISAFIIHHSHHSPNFRKGFCLCSFVKLLNRYDELLRFE